MCRTDWQYTPLVRHCPNSVLSSLSPDHSLSMRVIYPNLSFEDMISGRTTTPRSNLQPVVDALATLTGLLAEEGDVVLVQPTGIPSGLPQVLSHVRYLTSKQLSEVPPGEQMTAELVPWGWDHSARQLAMKLNHPMLIPPHDAVLDVNSRQFAAEFDVTDSRSTDLLFDGHFGTVCRTEQQFREAVDVLSAHRFSEWVAKPAWSAAGRGRLSGRCGTLSLAETGWLRKQLQADQYVWLEPRLNVVRECGIQLHISAPLSGGSGDVNVVGATQLLTDRQGRYRGSVVATDMDPVWQPALKHAVGIAHAAAEAGYFGPLGIDSMEVQLPDRQRVVRLCHDINARLTMGRLALQLLPLVPEGATGVWLHSAVARTPTDLDIGVDCPSDPDLADVQSVRVSPAMTGGRSSAVESWFHVLHGPQKSQNLRHLLADHAGLDKLGCDGSRSE